MKKLVVDKETAETMAAMEEKHGPARACAMIFLSSCNVAPEDMIPATRVLEMLVQHSEAWHETCMEVDKDERENAN
jgi:hypothetical protein